MTRNSKIVIAVLCLSQSAFANDERQESTSVRANEIPDTNKTENPAIKFSDAHGFYLDKFDHIGFESTLAILYDLDKPRGWYPRFGLGPTFGLSRTSRYIEAEFLTELYHNAVDWVDLRIRLTYGIGSYQSFRGVEGQQTTVSLFIYYGIPLPAVYYRQRIETSESSKRVHEYGIMMKFSFFDDEVGYYH